MKAVYTIIMLIAANIFMTLAWYGHLKMGQLNKTQNLSLLTIIFLSWGIALFEYMLQIPANKIGHSSNGGPFNLWQLKIIQEVVSVTIFTVFMLVFFKNESLRYNHIIGFLLMIAAVYFIFKK
jgi:uncharacterized protein (DUF486 family)